MRNALMPVFKRHDAECRLRKAASATEVCNAFAVAVVGCWIRATCTEGEPLSGSAVASLQTETAGDVGFRLLRLQHRCTTKNGP